LINDLYDPLEKIIKFYKKYDIHNNFNSGELLKHYTSVSNYEYYNNKCFCPYNIAISYMSNCKLICIGKLNIEYCITFTNKHKLTISYEENNYNVVALNLLTSSHKSTFDLYSLDNDIMNACQNLIDILINLATSIDIEKPKFMIIHIFLYILHNPECFDLVT
jgi:hypothetical protein